MTILQTSTYGMNLGMRTQVTRLQAQLTQAQQEASSGQIADIGLAKGLQTAQVLNFGYQQSQMQAIMDSNQVTTSRLDTTNQALDQILNIAKDFQTQLTSIKASSTDPAVLVTEAKASMQSLMSALSTSFAGEYVFSGIKGDTQPVPDFPGTPPGAGKTAIDSAFLAAFGFNQSSASVNTITDTQMTNFLTSTYSGLFDNTGWPTNFFQGSSTQLSSRIDAKTSIASSVTANDPAIRNIMQALTMVSELGGENLNQSAFTAVINKAITMTGTAQTGLTSMQTQIGIMQSRTKDATTDLLTQKNLLAKSETDSTGVDQYEVATRVNQLTTQLQTSYSLTSRMQQLSLLQYL